MRLRKSACAFLQEPPLFAQFEPHNSDIVHAACGGSVRLTVLYFVWQKWQKAAVQCARV